MHLQMSSTKRPFCWDLNVFNVALYMVDESKYKIPSKNHLLLYLWTYAMKRKSLHMKTLNTHASICFR